MSSNLYQLIYPQQNAKPDRRQQCLPVVVDRRSGIDRRVEQRLNLPKDVKKDIVSVKSNLDELYGDFKEYELKSDIDYYKALNDKTKHKEIRKTVLAALSPIVPFRRVSSLPDNIEDGNYERAAGIIALAVVNLPEDTRDLKSAAKQVFKGELPKYDYKEFQVPFSFFRGTVLQPIINSMGKLGEWLYSKDIPLHDTKLGEFLRRILKYEMNGVIKTKRVVPQVVFDDVIGKHIVQNIEVRAYKIEGKPFAKLVGRALLRMPVISVLILGMLEIPSIIKSFNKSKKSKDKVIDGSAQILKSGINITSILSGIGLVGALFARKGPAGSLLGMGIGSVIGAKFTKIIGNEIDSLTEKIKN